MNNEEYDVVQILISHFNDNSIVLVTFLKNYTKNQILDQIYPIIQNLVKEKSNKLIDLFVLKVLKYEDHIMEGNEDFFIGKDYESETSSNKSIISKIFEFKELLKTLDDLNKNRIKEYMKLLCRIARRYFDTLYGYRLEEKL